MTERDTFPDTGHVGVVDQPTRADRLEHGEKVRRRIPFAAMAEHAPARDRNPIGLLESQAAERVPDLVPIRYGRMAQSPFAFYRGAALVMADDLSRAQSTGLHTQLCGDAHLSNFGLFATPERTLAFDVNDFDETYPGPFEWDVKRLVASFAVAGRSNAFSGKQRKRIALACAAEYRETMSSQAERTELEVWYSHIDAAAQLDELRDVLDSSTRRRVQKTIDKSRGRDSVQALSRLTTMVDGRPRIVSTPPLVVPIEEIFTGTEAHEIDRELNRRLREYRGTLPPARRVLLDRYEYVQTARKVVGVGSVGTRAWIVLLRGQGGDPLFLQAKEAQRSVLEKYVAGESCANNGERVVTGQQLMQAASDIFLGWQQGPDAAGVMRDFYVRQLRDGKGSAVVETMKPDLMMMYGRLCARVLAYAHARAGDRFTIAGYLGSDEKFDKALAAFAEAYADQNERDFAVLRKAIEDGRITAHSGT
ncbi:MULTISPECIES: DUF2252 domain-containing protein [Rhodococcus]|uniref:DUF2252 domain-containing protein n=1 Tax=Rhodococcus oxybenzonivorans TaxID=1990687 RepID=A0AAE4V4A8_9NOCA|nr:MULTISPECIES: DUF2252 domain-containing protein [Rhodococcus]MDV7243522.1 DUF2252 domain-containing protein [Rhodococcus oxybenzonivorans]MDV7268142.1 DUF2252 domain-containing protein [Rhodococcus oxybenzonivorans]MDV7277498.1 DUF2252 domain-containing protein [Rhodococcus oxybenzonivorans]MDV7335474.1 DUF2252 domain-containing protein [Rhodococcus oxybenzonivorans]MDV7347210.1 DUF2252 domain-containing protein [Rhodococcus oxybenzonivorans]